MKRLLLVILAFALAAPAFCAISVNWVPEITVQPAAPRVGQTVTIKARFTVAGGTVYNLRIVGKVDGTVKYSQVFAGITGPVTKNININWTAKHSTMYARLAGQPSNVLIKFEMDPINMGPTTPYSGKKVEKSIKVYDAAPMLQARPRLVRTVRPKVQIPPCIANNNKTTDIVPTRFKLENTGYKQFRMTMKYENTGPRCVPSVKWRVTYQDNGVTKILKQGEHNPIGSKLYALEAGQSKYFLFAFYKSDFSPTAFETSVDQEEREIRFDIDLKFTVDWNNAVVETNEGNNSITKHLSWIED